MFCVLLILFSLSAKTVDVGFWECNSKKYVAEMFLAFVKHFILFFCYCGCCSYSLAMTFCLPTIKFRFEF